MVDIAPAGRVPSAKGEDPTSWTTADIIGTSEDETVADAVADRRRSLPSSYKLRMRSASAPSRPMLTRGGPRPDSMSIPTT